MQIQNHNLPKWADEHYNMLFLGCWRCRLWTNQKEDFEKLEGNLECLQKYGFHPSEW